MKILFTLLLATLLPSMAFGQSSSGMMYYPDNSVKVYHYGRALNIPWCGGFNNSQFSMGDLNNDGLDDLVVYTKDIGVQTFINKGTPGNPNYIFVPEYAVNFPPCTDFLVMVDFNRDHIPDILSQTAESLIVFMGYYNSSNQICFRYYKELLYTNDVSTGGPANVYNNPGDIPAVVDIDHDGDLDIVSYYVSGGYMSLYKNMQVEMGLPADSIYMDLKDNCWGKVFQAFWRDHLLEYSCNNSSLHSTPGHSAYKKTHQGNTPCLFDWDMDGDYDYLDGSISFNEMTFLKNGRIENGGLDSMVFQDTMWQTGGKQVEIPTWPAAFNVDVDQDGNKDLLISPNGSGFGLTPENKKCIWYYKNYSTPGHPDWRFVSDSFLTDNTIDIGSNAYPTLFDYNKDGKPDLFIGSDGYYTPATGLLKSRVSYYLNTSTPGNPSFTLQTDNFLNIDTSNFRGAALAFGDLDHDGKADMVIGHLDGSLSFYTNMAASDLVAPIWQLTQTSLVDASGTSINSAGNAAPFIYDVDKDGRPDLVLGNVYGTLIYYQNTSTVAGHVSLQLINSNLGHVQVDAAQVVGCNSVPFIGKIDQSGHDYLLMGSNSGDLYLYDSVGSGDTAASYPTITSQYSYIDSTGNGYNNYGSVFAANWNLRSAPTIGDIAGDGGLEMIVGDPRGGVRLYKLKPYDNTQVRQPVETGLVNLFPNPATNLVTVNWSGMQSDRLSLSVYNVAGQCVFSEMLANGSQHVQIPVNGYGTGLYVLVLQSGVNKYHSKFTVVR